MILTTKEQFEQAVLTKQEIKTKTVFYTGELSLSDNLTIGTYCPDKGIYAGVTPGKHIWVAMNDSPNVMTWDKAMEYPKDGYHVPTKEELMLIYINLDIINKALINNGGEALKDDYYWSSSEYSNYGSWIAGFNTSYGLYSNASKYYNGYDVRPVLALSI